ncbi:hypothetical protein PMAYCL1PPCAC_28846, partial [Pristionchus mayeri]
PPTAAAAAPVARTLSPTKHDETVKSLSEKLKTPSKDATVIDQVNELMSAALAVKEDLKSDEESNVEIRRPTAIYEKIVTVMEPEQVELHLHTSAPGGGIHHRFINLETILQKPGTSSASADTSISHLGKRNANAEHRIVVLEGTSQNFSDAMTWSLKKVKRAMEEGRSTPTTNAFVEIRRPGDTAEQVTTIAEPEEYIPELLQIASSASKLKMSNVTVSLVRAGDVAHQELVIEYESNVEYDADLAVKQLVFPGFSSHDEARWNKPRRDLFSASESMEAISALPPPSPHFQLQQQVQMQSPERQSDPNVVAVFVEVEAACPDQSVEIVAVVATPLTGQETSAEPSNDRLPQPRGSVAESASSITDDHSNMISISESSSGTGFEAPKFIRILTDSSARAGEPAVFKCLVRGVPMPEVRWSVDGDDLSNDADYTIIYEDGVCLLKINQVLIEDEGEYACEAFNDAGHAVTRAFLTVEQPPRPLTPIGQQLLQPAPVPPPRRFVQHAPLKTDVYDEEIEGGAETDYGDEEQYESATDLPAFCGSKKSLDRVSITSSKSRLVTSNSEFDLSRIMDYNQDLRESSCFVRYFDTAETMVVVRVLYEEERLSLTCREVAPSASGAPPTPKKRSIFHVPEIFKKKKAAPPVPPKTQKSIEEYQKELMRRSSTESAPTTPLTPRTETALEILEKAMENLDRETTPKVEEEVVLKRETAALEAPAANQSVVAAAAAHATAAALPTTNVDEVLSFIDGLKEELSFATAPSETQTEDDLRNELMSLTAGMGDELSPMMQRKPEQRESAPEPEPSNAPLDEPVPAVAPVPRPRRKKEQKTPEIALAEPTPEASVTVESPVLSFQPVQFEPEASPAEEEEDALPKTTVVESLVLAGEPTQFVPSPSPVEEAPEEVPDEPSATVIQTPLQTLEPTQFLPESPSPEVPPVVETEVLSESALESSFCATDEEDRSRGEEAGEAEIMLKRPGENLAAIVSVGYEDFAHTAFTPTALWNSAIFCDPFGDLPSQMKPIPSDEPRSALLPGKISFKGQEIGVRVEDIEEETERVNEQGTMERMIKKCKQATLDFDVPVAVKKLFSKSPSSTLEKEKKRLLEVDGVDSGLEKSPEGREIEPVTQKELMQHPDFDNDEFVLVDKIGAELLEEKDLDSIIDEESEAAKAIAGAYAEAPERVTEASVAVIMQRRNTAEETELNMELQRRRSEIPILTESDTSAAASPPMKPKRGMERRPTIESETPLLPSAIQETPSESVSVQYQMVVAEVHFEPPAPEENNSFTDDEGLLRPGTLHDLGGESSDSSFHATESRTLPKEDSAKIRAQISKMKEVERIAKRVEAELSALNAASNSKEIEIDEDVKHIEEAIISVSEQLALAHPVSEAQAEASEELLRTTLAAMILNPDVDPNEEAESLKKPIQILRRKLSEIENSLMEDVEVEEVLSHEEGTPEEAPEGAESERSTPAPRKTMKKVPSTEYLRVTPLTTNIKEQLTTLENMIEEASEFADRNESSDEHRPLVDKTPSPSGTGKRMAMPKRKELHDLFVQINNEINTIRAYCKRKLPKQGTEAVMNVLGKVKTHVTTIVNIMQVAKKKAAHAAAKSPSRLGKTYKRLRNEKEKEKMSSSMSDAEEFIDMKEVRREETVSKSETSTRVEGEEKESTPVPPPRRRRTASADPGPTAPPRTRRAEASADSAITRQKSATLGRPTKANIEAAIKKAFTLPASLRKEKKKEEVKGEEEEEVKKSVQVTAEAAPPVLRKDSSRSESTEKEKDQKIVSRTDSVQSTSLKSCLRKFSTEEAREVRESAPIREPEEKEEEPVSVYESEQASELPSDVSSKKESPQFKRDAPVLEKKVSRSDSAMTDSPKQDSSRLSSRKDEKSEHKDEKILSRRDSAGSCKMSTSSREEKREKSPALKNFVPFHRRGKEDARKASLASHFDELSSLCLENTTSTPERESGMIDRLEAAEKEEKEAIEAIMRELAAENIYSGGDSHLGGDTPIDEILAREEVRAACATPAENVSVDCRIEVEEDNWRADSVVLPDAESMERSAETVASSSDDVQSSTIRRTATTSTSVALCQMEASMATNGEKEALGIEVPLSEIVKTRTLLLEDVDSVQMLCEESDYGTDTETSCLLRGTARSYPRPSSLLGLPSQAKAFKTLSDCGSIREEDIPAIIEWPDAVNVDLDVHVHQKSESIAEEFGAAASLKLPQLRQPEADNASMQDIESIRNFVMEEEPSAAPEINIVRDVEILPTIAERSEITTTTSRTSTLKGDQEAESLALVIDEHALSQMVSTETSLGLPKSNLDLRSPTIRETDILSDEGSLVSDTLPQEERVDIYIELINRRSPSAHHILAIVAPEQRQAMAAALGEEGDTFDVVIEQEPESAGFTVRVHDEIVDYSSLYVVASGEERGRKTARPQSFHRLSQLSITSSNPQLVTPSMLDLDEITEYSSEDEGGGGGEGKRVKTGVNVSIIARSMHDMVHASLEEIPWGEVVLALPSSIPGVMMRSGDSASLQFNVTVSESNEQEKRSLHSSMSERLSESLSIPSYCIKVGSTATITCELNNYLPKDAQIEWYRGKTAVHRQPGKVDRISHDLLEVLVISHVTMGEGDLYSLAVNGELFPVAYLVIEEAEEGEGEEPLLILSPPQTLFVMDGQPAILSVQVVDPSIHVHWFKERKPLVENERIRFEDTPDEGWRTVVIRETELTDQGTYYAYVDEQMTSVTLVVEERIREREVHVPPSGVSESEEDSEALREYLVPPGCTATIACELEASEEERELCWLRDDREIRFGGDNNQKIEHVKNGLKHYLVIHDTAPEDGGVYSVVISGVRFNVAHLAVNDLQTSIQKACKKKISNNSLH